MSSRTRAFRPAAVRGLAALLVVSLSGCGYALVGRGSNLPADIADVYVEPLENGTSRPQVEQILTRAISEELVTRRRYAVVDLEAADAILRGTVKSFDVRPVGFDADGLASNFEIAITADMVFRRVPAPGEEEGEVLWQNSRYVFRQDYPLEGAGADYFDRENLAVEETAEEFAETLVTDLLEGF